MRIDVIEFFEGTDIEVERMTAPVMLRKGVPYTARAQKFPSKENLLTQLGQKQLLVYYVEERSNGEIFIQYADLGRDRLQSHSG